VLQAVKARGYAVSERRSGTFVTRPKLTNGILVLDGFTDKLRKNSFSPSWRLVQQAIRTPDTRFSLNA
jgi:DNA-binding GntR family transcriptional regulator